MDEHLAKGGRRRLRRLHIRRIACGRLLKGRLKLLAEIGRRVAGEELAAVLGDDADAVKSRTAEARLVAARVLPEEG